VGDSSIGGAVKPSDQRQPGRMSSPQSQSVPGIHPLGLSFLQSQVSSANESQWTGSTAVMSPGQQPTGNVSLPSVSLAPGSVLPINLLSAELSSLLGMNATSTASSATLPLNFLVPHGLIVSADSGNVQDPLDSLRRLNTGMHGAIANSSTAKTEVVRVPEYLTQPHAADVKSKQESTHSYIAGRQISASDTFNNRLTISVSEPSPLPSGPSAVKQEDIVGELPQSTPPSAYFPALQQLLQQATTTRFVPPAYPLESESGAPTAAGILPASVESALPPSGRRRWTSADGNVFFNRRSGWGVPEHSADNAAASLFRQESSGFDVSKSGLLLPDGRAADPAQVDKDLAEFSAPSGLGLNHKFKRQNRPQPLIIPSPVGHFGFQSRLRSPRISEQSGPGLATETVISPSSSVSSLLQVSTVAGLTPYTPPPMLSPVRTGSGLFCSLVQPSPKSAPVGFRLGLLRFSK